MKQKIAFLYLNTGGGHIAPAKALANGVKDAWPDEVDTFLVNGFSEKMRMCRLFFENGYQATSNYFEPGYVLFYRMTEHSFFRKFGTYLVSIHGENHLYRFLRDNGITKVVCLHEVLIEVARKAIDRLDPSIPLITLVTDPYTAHAIWFYQKRTELVVFSEKLRKEAIERYGFDPSRVHAFPFILNRAYDRRYSDTEIFEAKRRLGLPTDRKLILVAGGGEGLRSADRIVSEFVSKKRDEVLIVVCGKNKLLMRQLKIIIEWKRATNVILYGFVSFMPDLLNVADCVITKGGASTVMEVLAVGKPVIFSTFIRGQELGNVLFAVYGGAGWFIRKPKDILAQAERVIDDGSLGASVRRNIDALGIRNGLDGVRDFIHSFSE
jgi:processive 1,2-diacylglycerol beta-glucosyltransferase/1,2-diacylglycerol 3-beta-galactosyltransferase